MAAEYLTLVTALLAAALGGGIALLTTFLTNRANTARLQMEQSHQAQRRKSELLRERGEELYELADSWLKRLGGYYLGRVAVMKGKITFNQCLDLEIQAGEKDTDNFGRIEMLVDVYFPTVRAPYDALIAGRDEMNAVVSVHKHTYKGGDIDGTRFLKPFVQAQRGIEETGESLKKRIIECIRAV